jgi:hypothetical protein
MLREVVAPPLAAAWIRMMMNAAERIAHLKARFPEGGLFRDKEWLLSPDAFPLEPATKDLITALGPALRQFQSACNELYFHSAEDPSGPQGWVARLLDAGKPAEVVQLGRQDRWRRALPSVLRPDLVLTEDGVCISELDSLPGGMGLTAWLGESFAQLGERILGGAAGMVEGFRAAFPATDVLISRESADYEPEMRWLLERAAASGSVWHTEQAAETISSQVYRFFELFDLPNVEQAERWLSGAMAGDLHFTPPLKAFLEEKLWLALFHNPQLRRWWQRLGEIHDDLLLRCIPMGWVLDPQRLPAWAVYPGLEVNSWHEMKSFGARARELVVKISGFSEKGWGSRGVEIGHDLSQAEWARVIDEALASFTHHPHVLQRFHKGKTVQHAAWDDSRQATRQMKSRVRLCPYYFVPHGTDETMLGGVLATVCPADKKILHGMKDAMMLPCV